MANLMSKKALPPINKICVLRLSALGDVCNTVAIVQQIQRQWPHVSITWIIGKVEYALLKNLHGIDFVVFDKSKGLVSYVLLYKALKRHRFDALLHMQSTLHASLASLCVRAHRKIGFDKTSAREAQWLFTNEKIAAQQRPHLLDEFMAFAHTLGLAPFTPRWEVPVESGAEHWVKFITAGKPYVVLSSSAGSRERIWNVDGYRELVKYLTTAGFVIVLTSGPNQDEVNIARHIALNSERKVINLAGSTNLQELLALIRHTKFVVSPDAGPIHIATMLDVPVIGIFAHNNPLRTGPWRFREYTVSHYEANILEQTGKPAARLAWGKRAKGQHLMNEIKFEEVKAKIDLLLKQDLRQHFNS